MNIKIMQLICLHQEAGLYTVTASNRVGSCSQYWRLEMLEQKKADVQITQSARESPEEEEIVPDDSVISGDITDPEFLQIMVSQMDTSFEPKTVLFREGGWMRTNLVTMD